MSFVGTEIAKVKFHVCDFEPQIDATYVKSGFLFV